MEFIDILQEFAAKTGLNSLKPDQDGSLSLLFDGQHELVFTPDTEDHAVFLYSEVGDSTRLDKEDCLTLLKASLLGAETGGAALAVQDELGKVILWKRYDAAFADLAALETAINSVLAQVIFWKERLSGLVREGRSNAPEDLKSGLDDINTFLQGGIIRG